MSEPDGGRYSPPPLPAVKASLFHIVAPCTVVWFVVLIVLVLDRDSVRAGGHSLWVWTAAAGSFLGCLGLAIYAWQRSAARRGSRAAQQMALDEKI